MLLLNQPSTVTALQNADPGDARIGVLVQQANEINRKISSVSHFRPLIWYMLVSFLQPDAGRLRIYLISAYHY